MARPPEPFSLSAQDQLELEGWLRKTSLSQTLAMRARILLSLNQGQQPHINFGHPLHPGKKQHPSYLESPFLICEQNLL